MDRATYSSVDRRRRRRRRRVGPAGWRRDAGVSSRLSELEAALTRPTVSYQPQIISHPPQPSSAHKSNVIIGALIIFIRRVYACSCSCVILRLGRRRRRRLSSILSRPPRLPSSIYVHRPTHLRSHRCRHMHVDSMQRQSRATSLVGDGHRQLDNVDKVT